MIQFALNNSPLALQLRERILRDGPISFYDWMRAALYDPNYGYYCLANGNRWGREGDYRTSPEFSPLFSATFARYFAKLYEDLGRPATWTILEAGAGEGHFAAGVLKTLRQCFPLVFEATKYVVDELSPASRTKAQERLNEFRDRVNFAEASQVEINAGVVFTNELLDALPVHRIMLHEGELNEFYVTVNGEGEFVWELQKLSAEWLARIEAYFAAGGLRPTEGQATEVCLEVEDWLKRVANQLGRGYVVTVDYGFTEEHAPLETSGTLRGFQRHQHVDDLLTQPGEHDLTATVNWDFVKATGTQHNLETVEFERQDRFLLSAGLLEQLELETANSPDEAERTKLRTSVREMILPNSMATHFQVLVQKRIS
jgi:SAM-dependent MidA family methyltransferase